MSATTYTKAGVKATVPAKLDKHVFAVTPKSHELLRAAYETYLANGRTNNAQTKTRGLVRGGGKKPWRQKGTGRARFGSSRNPIWRGGGIVFGPTGNENYSKKLNLKAKRLAIRQALSMANDNSQIFIIEALDPKAPKTAEMQKLLVKIGALRKVLLVVDNKSKNLDLATRNLSNVKLVQAKYLNVYDIMNADQIVITAQALPIITEWLAITEKAKD